MRQRYRAVVQYIGTRYHGFARSEGFPTVQEALDRAVAVLGAQTPNNNVINAMNVAGEEDNSRRKRRGFCVGAGRTDAGVHALGQVIHFDLSRTQRKTNDPLEAISGDSVKNAVNYYLRQNQNADIQVVSASKVSSDFHARYSARMRHYVYRVELTEDPSLFESHRSWHVPEQLDFEQMQLAADVLEGEHDFSSFRGSRCQARSPIRRIEAIKLDGYNITEDFSPRVVSSASLCQTSSSSQLLRAIATTTIKQPDILHVRVASRGFLYNQVRRMVGALVDVGRGKISVSQVREILEKRDNSLLRTVAPPHGLYFAKVEYDNIFN